MEKINCQLYENKSSENWLPRHKHTNNKTSKKKLKLNGKKN